MKVVVCAGGTGGHLFPACALYKDLQKNGHDVCMITDKRGEVFCDDIQRKIVFDTIRFSYKKIISLIVSFIAVFFRLLKIWRRKRPNVMV
nr:glycosyltransferase [Alphaproteobacteria bacterium]